MGAEGFERRLTPARERHAGGDIDFAERTQIDDNYFKYSNLRASQQGPRSAALDRFLLAAVILFPVLSLTERHVEFGRREFELLAWR